MTGIQHASLHFSPTGILAAHNSSIATSNTILARRSQQLPLKGNCART